ncbi:hypothetical protein ACFV29_00845 [Streptomyces sp. NPDC059690]|uniref:hypothetical protein n=1 Tax=Streptomyces sp. NPDC059690 TaxID=3346907 RepID=UPI0036D19152
MNGNRGGHVNNDVGAGAGRDTEGGRAADGSGTDDDRRMPDSGGSSDTDGYGHG